MLSKKSIPQDVNNKVISSLRSCLHQISDQRFQTKQFSANEKVLQDEIQVCIYNYLYVSFCMGRSMGKAGIQFKCFPKKRNTTEMCIGKIMCIIGE